MGGELREEKTHFCPISSTQRCLTLPDMQGSHKAVQLLQLRGSLPPKGVCCFFCAGTAGPAHHGDSREAGKERGRLPIVQDTDRALERGSGLGHGFPDPWLLVISVIPPPLR